MKFINVVTYLTVMDVDFRVASSRSSLESGIYFPVTRRVIIYLNQHESIGSIINTITHESIHYVIDKYKHENLDDYQEHEIIFRALWAEEYIPD